MIQCTEMGGLLSGHSSRQADGTVAKMLHWVAGDVGSIPSSAPGDL